MIIVINSSGGVVSLQDEDLFQGSTNLNHIDLIAPFASNVIFKAMFQLPDGTYKPDNLDGYVFNFGVDVVEGLNTWRLPITFPITQDYGTVEMQIRGMIGDTVVCTTSVKLPIQKGIPYASDYEEMSDKDELLQLIAELRALLNNKTDKVAYHYVEATNIDNTSIGTYYVIDNGQYVAKTLPNDYQSGATYYELTTTTRVVNTGSDVYLEYIDETSQDTMKLKIEKDKATLNDKQIVVFDDLTANNVAYDDTNTELSAQNVQEALEKLKLNLDNAASIMDVGDVTISSDYWRKEGDVYVYDLGHRKLTDVSKQSVIITPNNTSINLLNANNILVYPTVEMSAFGFKHAIIKADARPSFDIVANLKIVNNKIDGDFTPLTASQISYSNTIAGEQIYNVDKALDKLNTCLSFDYIVDNNTKLRAWANNLNNDNGRQYISVLIKKGTYTINRPIDLSASYTSFVYAEPGAQIKFTASSGFTDNPLRDTIMFNVHASTIDLTTTNNFVFNGIGNLYHCKAELNSSIVENLVLYGFVSCNNLTGCQAYRNNGLSKAIGFSQCSKLNFCTASMIGETAYGFELCSNLTDCIGEASGRSDARGFYKCTILRSCQGLGAIMYSRPGIGYGFSDCKGVCYCKREDSVSTSTTSTFDNNCYADISTTENNPDYLVANTPAGGFNDVT